MPGEVKYVIKNRKVFLKNLIATPKWNIKKKKMQFSQQDLIKKTFIVNIGGDYDNTNA